MGFYKVLKENWKKADGLYKDRMVEWRREPATTRIERPTRLDKARELGYKAKQGFVIVRQRVIRGGHDRPSDRGGRKPKNNGLRMNLNKNYQMICEERANKKFLNCEVLNSYFLTKDGKYYWYEVILVDRDHPAIKADKDLKWVSNPSNKGRVFRGLTSAARKFRGLRHKGMGAEKVR